ncbi:hypothetical protein B0J17DRAFT_724223 [Rhizoctonia solani]|nr:hypothetical protein B0J17DRAFT_724223 [Rhizoctonia solani]
MSQCPSVFATPTVALESQEEWGTSTPIPSTPRAASIAALSPELIQGQLPLLQLSIRTCPIHKSDNKSLISSGHPPLSRWRLGTPTNVQQFFDCNASTAPSMAVLENRGASVPASSDPEDIGVLPQSGRRFHHKGKCYLLTYAQYVASDHTGHTTWYDTIKELVSHLYTLQHKGHSLLEYAVGVTELHDLKEGQWQPDWHCHVIVWAKELISSESLNLWKFQGCRPHERLLLLKVDSGGFPPLMAFRYLQKEKDAWEACFGNLTEEFLQSQDPGNKGTCHQDFQWAAKASNPEEFYTCLLEKRAGNLICSFGGVKQFAAWRFKNGEDGICPPKELNSPTVNLPEAVMPWVTSNILECDPNSDCGKILVLWGPSGTGKSAFAQSLGHHIQFRQTLNSDQLNNNPKVQYAILDDMEWSKTPLKMWVQEDFNFCTSYCPEHHCKWGRSTIICSNTKPLVFADCDYNTTEGQDWIDTNVTFVHIGNKLY